MSGTGEYIFGKHSGRTKRLGRSYSSRGSCRLDGEHANLTLDGSYYADSIVIVDVSPIVDLDWIMRRIQIRFSGILDYTTRIFWT